MKEEEIDNQIRKWIQSDALVEAPEGFSEMVMEKVMKAKNNAISTEPIISNKQWVFIIVCFASLLTLSFFGDPKVSEAWEWYFSMDMFSVSLSKTFVFSLLVFTVFLFLQIYFIRNRVEEMYR